MTNERAALITGDRAARGRDRFKHVGDKEILMKTHSTFSLISVVLVGVIALAGCNQEGPPTAPPGGTKLSTVSVTSNGLPANEAVNVAVDDNQFALPLELSLPVGSTFRAVFPRHVGTATLLHVSVNGTKSTENTVEIVVEATAYNIVAVYQMPEPVEPPEPFRVSWANHTVQCSGEPQATKLPLPAQLRCLVPGRMCGAIAAQQLINTCVTEDTQGDDDVRWKEQKWFDGVTVTTADGSAAKLGVLIQVLDPPSGVRILYKDVIVRRGETPVVFFSLGKDEGGVGYWECVEMNNAKDDDVGATSFVWAAGNTLFGALYYDGTDRDEPYARFRFCVVAFPRQYYRAVAIRVGLTGNSTVKVDGFQPDDALLVTTSGRSSRFTKEAADAILQQLVDRTRSVLPRSARMSTRAVIEDDFGAMLTESAKSAVVSLVEQALSQLVRSILGGLNDPWDDDFRSFLRRTESGFEVWQTHGNATSFTELTAVAFFPVDDSRLNAFQSLVPVPSPLTQ